jgi:hypothetical protein
MGRRDERGTMRAYQVRAHDGYRLFVRREGSHATPSASASAATTTLSHTVEKTTAFVRRVTGSSRIAPLQALGLHLTQRGVAGDARVMFRRDLMLQTRCFACYTLRKRGRCGGDESGGRKRDDRSLHFFGPPSLEIRSPAQPDELEPFPEQATSRCSERVELTLETG